MTATTGDRPTAHLRPSTQARSLDEIACRALDLVLGAALLIVLLPVMLVIALIIRLDSGGSPLFRQRRIGRGRVPFTVNKFRTMVADASPDVHRRFVLSLIDGGQPSHIDGKPQFKLSSDHRVTRFGRILRRTSLDELPQLWNVVRGEMSLVGPRPAISYEVEHYPPHWLERFVVKPGMTGLWQVSGRSELTMADMVKLDLEYAMHRSLGTNIRILLKTVPVVLSRRGAS